MPRARHKKSPARQTELLAQAIGVPDAQAKRGDLVVCDAPNFTDAQQRHAIRSKQTETVRRLTRVERLTRAKVIGPEQALACEYYAKAYELGYQTIGCTANYLGAGGGGFGSSDLFSRYKAQGEARENYAYARQGIPAHLIDLFEAIVLHGGDEPGRWTMIDKRDRLAFSQAAFLLHGQIAHLLAIAA